ncbi:MAG: hypothetical protein U9Q75_07595 [Pseudomonadota bacterium]|nr:hypothetical protein [Pseudomonadota bacterium]
MSHSGFDQRRFVNLVLLGICVVSGSLFAAEKEPYVVEMVLLEEPPFQHFSTAGVVERETRHITLEEVAVSANKIVDEEAWFSENGLSLESASMVPPKVAAEIDGHQLLRAIPADDYLALVYADEQGEGRYLFLWSMKSRRYAYGFDFGSYMHAPGGSEVDKQVITQSIDWVIVSESVVYVSHSHKTFSGSSRGMNAYITAIDLNTRRLLWRSDPLVSNAANFIVVGNTIISGYGFSAEPDYLYLLDTSNGRQIEKIALRTGPQYIISKDDQLFVRTYNTDYVFRVMRPQALSESPEE